MYENNKYKDKIRVTTNDNRWLKKNFKNKGYKSAAAYLEEIIDKEKRLTNIKRN